MGVSVQANVSAADVMPELKFNLPGVSVQANVSAADVMPKLEFYFLLSADGVRRGVTPL
jgi:hypothetical protein